MKQLFILAVIACAVTACSLEKQTAKIVSKAKNNETAYKRIGRSYIAVFGCLADTPIVVYSRGRTDTILTERRDTVREKVPCDSFVSKTKNGTTVSVDGKGNLTTSGKDTVYMKHDTTKYTLVDRTQNEILKDDATGYRIQAAENKADAETVRAENERLKRIFFAQWAAIFVLGGYSLYRTFKS